MLFSLPSFTSKDIRRLKWYLDHNHDPRPIFTKVLSHYTVQHEVGVQALVYR